MIKKSNPIRIRHSQNYNVSLQLFYINDFEYDVSTKNVYKFLQKFCDTDIVYYLPFQFLNKSLRNVCYNTLVVILMIISCHILRINMWAWCDISCEDCMWAVLLVTVLDHVLSVEMTFCICPSYGLTYIPCVENSEIMLNTIISSCS